MKRKINHGVFWPPFLLLFGSLVYSLVNREGFLHLAKLANAWILEHFNWLFSYTSFGLVICCLLIAFSPLGKIRIGGAEAKRLLSPVRWFAIVLCTTVAVGILFWGVSEPLYHLSNPPEGYPAEANSQEARAFAMSTMFMHWTFTPYAIYTIPALLFAIGYYNYKGPYSLSSMLFVFPRLRKATGLVTLIDAICLFALVAGMAAALGAGILSLTGGWARLTDLEVAPWTLGIITLIIVASFSISAATGLLKGIRLLSTFNLVIFLILCFFILLVGPAAAIGQALVDGLGAYVVNFIPHSLGYGDFTDTNWSNSWTTFYWANWMAWAPITCLFLGRISLGYTVREFLICNWVLPSVFSIIWMSVFSGTSIYLELDAGIPMVGLLQTDGPESIMYEVLAQLPGTSIMTAFFLLTMYISYVTAADSTTEAMSGISSQGVSPESPNPPLLIKFLWGFIIGIVAWTMVSFSGIDGVKMLSNLGGLPALFLLLALLVASLRWVWQAYKKTPGDTQGS